MKYLAVGITSAVVSALCVMVLMRGVTEPTPGREAAGVSTSSAARDAVDSSAISERLDQTNRLLQALLDRQVDSAEVERISGSGPRLRGPQDAVDATPTTGRPGGDTPGPAKRETGDPAELDTLDDWNTSRDTRREWLLRTDRELIAAFGLPHSITASGSGEQWLYPALQGVMVVGWYRLRLQDRRVLDVEHWRLKKPIRLADVPIR